MQSELEKLRLTLRIVLGWCIVLQRSVNRIIMN
jgi:hypothetical protein